MQERQQQALARPAGAHDAHLRRPEGLELRAEGAVLADALRPSTGPSRRDAPSARRAPGPAGAPGRRRPRTGSRGRGAQNWK